VVLPKVRTDNEGAAFVRGEGQRPGAIARELGIRRASVFRVLKAAADTQLRE
jgi:hypothetical protein